MRLDRPRLAAAALAAFALTGCQAQRQAAEQAVRLTGGDPDRGRWAIRQYGCASCHSVPGVLGADGLVGPPLDRIGARTVLAGHLPNTPANMVRWIRHPRQVRPDTAMPDTGLGEPEARDIAAYLYTLR
jgi:cytochrome c1